MQSSAPFEKLRWTAPKDDPQDLAYRYVKSLDGAPGVIKIWGCVVGHRLTLYTLVSGSLSTRQEDRVYEAEAEVHSASEDAEVEVRILHEGAPLPAAVKNAIVLYPFPG